MRYSIPALIALTLSGSVLAKTSLDIWWHGEQQPPMAFDKDILLSQAVKQVALSEPIYWPTAQISTADRQQKMLQFKEQVLVELAALANWAQQEGRPVLVSSAEQLKVQLSELAVTGRFEVPVDPDILRASEIKDPLLQGSYQLFLAPRHAVLTVFGLTESKVIPIVPGMLLRDYWKSLTLDEDAEPAHVYLIDTNGQSHRVPVAIWNAERREPAPGAALYVGLDTSSLPAEFTPINDHVLTLLANRMP